MLRLAEMCERIAATTKRTEKIAAVAEYLSSRDLVDAEVSALFLSGRTFPTFEERTLQIGGSSLWKLVSELSHASDARMRQAYRQCGDLGAAAYHLLAANLAMPKAGTLTLAEIRSIFDQVAETRTAGAKAGLLLALFERATPLEAKYILKIITGDLRIGLKESLVEEAIAKAYDEPLNRVQRVNMLLGDIGGALRLAAEHRLEAARMRLFHPVGFMLASPAADASEAFEYFDHAQIEDKYDGIRAQAHCSGQQVRLFSRTLDELTGSFPELIAPLGDFTEDAVLDGEIVAWQHSDEGEHAMPFSEIQKRLGRKQVSQALLAEVPVAYVVFDVIFSNRELTLDKPLHQRMQILDHLFAGAKRVEPKGVLNAQGRLSFEPGIEEQATSGWIIRAPAMGADSPEQLTQMFEEAMARGNEGLMIKDVNSLYLPGRRGRWWLKLKRELAVLDVVVTAAEYGHGKRIHVLSDYTFAVRKGEELVNIGKAYSGLTDAEIMELTEWFLANTISDHGYLREVEPKIILEVAFNAIMQSDRHNSGYALRFPRILRLRRDKLPAEISTIDEVERIYLRQHGRTLSK